MHRQRRYVGLSVVIIANYVFAGLVVVSFIISLSLIGFGTAEAASAADEFGPEPTGFAAMGGMLAMFFSFMIHGPAFIFFLSMAEGIKLIIDIQKDTHKTAQVISKLDLNQPPPLKENPDPTKIQV